MPKTVRTRKVLFALAILPGLFFLNGPDPVRADTDELTEMGLPPDTGRDEVEAYCDPCHSLKLVVQQGLSRTDWEETIEWMVEEQEMEPIDPEDYKLVLDYLAKYVSIEANLKKRQQK